MAFEHSVSNTVGPTAPAMLVMFNSGTFCFTSSINSGVKMSLIKIKSLMPNISVL